MENLVAVEVIDNTKKYKEMLKDAIDDICDSIGNRAEGHAKDDCPVDTGRLRASITYATKKHSGFSKSYTDKDGNKFSNSIGKVTEDGAIYIGSNVEYAEENELYNPNGKSHFLRNAATQHSAEYKAVVLARMNA